MAEVKPDPGAGVGKSGVKTPWENGDRKKSEWQTANKGTQGWEETSRKTASGEGREADKPWEEVCQYPPGGSKQ